MRAGKRRGFVLLPVVLALTLIAAIAFLLNRESGINTSMAARGFQADAARYAAEAGLAQINAQTQTRNCNGYTDLSAATFGSASFSATVNPKAGSPVTLASTATLADGTTSTLTRSNVSLRQIIPAVSNLQPGAAGIDTYMSKPSSNFNYGAAVDLKVSPGSLTTLLRFDLSSIPAGSEIRSAQLWLYHTNGGTDSMTAYRVSRVWSEGTQTGAPSVSGATWATTNAVQAWTTPGGDYDPASGVTTTLGVNGTWSSWDLTALTVAWTGGTQPNYGIALVAPSSGNNAFASSDEPNATLRPRFTVNFLPPCGWVPPASGGTLIATQDTWIDESGNGKSNYGTSSSFTVTNAGKRGRGLVRFDLSTVPPGTPLTSATLRLWVSSISPMAGSILTVNKVYDPWPEGSASWISRDGSNGWSAGFGIYWGFGAGDPVSTSAISSSFSSGWVEWNVTALAQQWVNNPSTNYGAGVMIDTSSAVIFNSREATAHQPELVITY